ncbi:MAG: hypothetical protein ACREQT_13720 [Candidatus Binataceae bacterium]
MTRSAGVGKFDAFLSAFHQVLPLADAREGHRMMEASEHFGKIVLRVR